MAEATERRVRMLGGPEDGRVLLATCLEIETLGVREGDDWRLPGQGDTHATHVYYRVRRTVDEEWVATFEGPRPIESLL